MERSGYLTGVQVQEILRLYPDCPAAEIARRLGKPVSTVYKTAARYGVRKSEAFRNSPLSGRIQKGQRLSPATELKKGNVPATRGKKLADVCKSEEALDRSVAHRWKKGNKTPTTKYDGAVTVRRNRDDGSGGVTFYQMIRISEGKWEFLHRHLWRQVYGSVPEGYNVIFLDGNPMNCTIENLACVSHGELLDRNRNRHYPPELKRLIRARNKLSRDIRDLGDSGDSEDGNE